MNIIAHNNTQYLIGRIEGFMKDNEAFIRLAGVEDAFVDLQAELCNQAEYWEETDEEYQEKE